MEEVAPNALQEAGFGIPSHYLRLYYTQLTYIVHFKILCCTMVHHILQWWEGNQSFSRKWIWHPISLYDMISTYSTDRHDTILCCTICIKFCNGGDGTQSFSRRWIWHPISLYDTILYSIDVCYHILIFIKLCKGWRWRPIPFKKLDLASHLTI